MSADNFTWWNWIEPFSVIIRKMDGDLKKKKKKKLKRTIQKGQAAQHEG